MIRKLVGGRHRGEPAQLLRERRCGASPLHARRYAPMISLSPSMMSANSSPVALPNFFPRR
jgi:hypothetical protein